MGYFSPDSTLEAANPPRLVSQYRLKGWSDKAIGTAAHIAPRYGTDILQGLKSCVEVKQQMLADTHPLMCFLFFILFYRV